MNRPVWEDFAPGAEPPAPTEATPATWEPIDPEGVRAELEAARRPRTFACGFGGLPRCRVRLPQRGLCPEHSALIRAAAGNLDAPAPAGGRTITRTKGARLPDQRRQSTESEREALARRMGEHMHAHGAMPGPDVAAALGVSRGSRLFRHARDIATARRWVRNAGRSGLAPGEARPE